jgi:hypothetical protein
MPACQAGTGRVWEADVPREGSFEGALAPILLVRVDLGFDAFARGRRASPVQVPQGFLEALLVQRGQLAEELLAVHPSDRHGR